MPLRWRLAAGLMPPGGAQLSGQFPRFFCTSDEAPILSVYSLIPS